MPNMPIVARKLLTSEQLTGTKKDNEKITELHVRVMTNRDEYSGTNANVYLNLNSADYELDTEDYNDFERGDDDTYIIPVNINLGELRQSDITLWHDDTGRHSGWKVKELRLYVRFANKNYPVLYKRWTGIGWLAKDEPPGETGVHLQFAPELC